LGGMPGFTHYSPLTRVDPDAQAIAAVDFNGDGKADLCLVGGGRVGLLQNGGESLSEVSLPGAGGCRAAVWADYDGDGRPDFLYGAGSGMLALNTPKGFVEARDSGIVYRPGKVGPVFGDFDNDGHPDLFVPQAGGSKLFRNDGQGHFADVTEKAGL